MPSGNQRLDFAIRAVNEASATLRKVQGDIEATGASAERASTHASAFGGALGGVAKVAGGFVLARGILAAPGALMGMAKAAAADEAATLRLNQALKNYAQTQDDADQVLKELTGDMQERIVAGQKLAFTDDDIRDSLETLLAATDDYGEATQRQAAAMDLARAKGISLEAASKLLGKINEENVDVFRRMGIELADNATEADALAAVQARFGGQAEAYAKSTAGQFEQAQIRMAEVKETIGAALLPLIAKLGVAFVDDVLPKVEAFAGAVGPVLGRVGAAVNEHVLPVLRRVGEFLVDVLGPQFERFGAFVREQWAKFGAYYEENLRPAFENIMAGVGAVVFFFREHWSQIEPIVRPVVEQIQNVIETAFGVIREVIEILVDLIGGDFSGAWNNLKDLIGVVWDGIRETIENQIEVLKGLGKLFIDVGESLIKGLIQGIKNMAGKVIETIQREITDRLPGFVRKALGIGSPSRVFAEIGMQIGAGLAGGIESSAPGVERATRRLLGATGGAGFGVGAGAAGGRGGAGGAPGAPAGGSVTAAAMAAAEALRRTLPNLITVRLSGDLELEGIQ